MGLGYSLHSALAPTVQPPIHEECGLSTNESVDSIKTKFEAIAKADYEEYLQLKTEAEKFKKADEILTKIMSIFMADLGLHLVHTVPAPSISPSPPKAESKAITLQANYTAAKDLVEKLRTDSQNEDFLKKSVLSNPKQGLFDAGPITRINPKLKGCFEGESTNSGRHLKMKLWIGNIANSGPSLQNFKSVILENGKMINHQSGLFRNSFLTLNANDQNEFIFNSSPGTFYQLYYVPLEDKLIGENYSIQPDATYKLTGTTNLNRGESTCAWIKEIVW